MEHIIPDRFIRMCRLLEITTFPVHWKFEEKDQQIVVTFIWNIGSSDVPTPVQATPKVESTVTTDSKKDSEIQKQDSTSSSKQPASHRSALKLEIPTKEAISTDKRRSKSRSSSRTTSPIASSEDRKSNTSKQKQKTADNKEKQTDTWCEKTHNSSSSKHSNLSNNAKVSTEKTNGSKISDSPSAKHRHSSSNSEKKHTSSSSKNASSEKGKSSVRSSSDSKHRHSSSKSNSSTSSSKAHSKSSDKTAKPEIGSNIEGTKMGTDTCGHTETSKPSNESVSCVALEVKHKESGHKQSSSRKENKTKDSTSHSHTDKKYRESRDVKIVVKPSSQDKQTEPSLRHVKENKDPHSRREKTNKDPQREKSKKDSSPQCETTRKYSSSQREESQECVNAPRKKAHHDVHCQEPHVGASLGCEPMREESLSEQTPKEPSSRSFKGWLCKEQSAKRSSERCEHKPEVSISLSEQTLKGSHCDSVSKIAATKSEHTCRESRCKQSPKRSSSSSSREKTSKEPSSRCKQTSKDPSSKCEPRDSQCDQSLEKSILGCEQSATDLTSRCETIETVEQMQCEQTIKSLDMQSGELTATESKTSRDLTSKDSKSGHHKTSKETISERNKHSKNLNSKTKNTAEKMQSSRDRNKHPMKCSVRTNDTKSKDKSANSSKEHERLDKYKRSSDKATHSTSSGLSRGKRRAACIQEEQPKKLKLDTDIKPLDQYQEVKPLDQSMEVTHSQKQSDSVDQAHNEISPEESNIEISQRRDTKETTDLTNEESTWELSIEIPPEIPQIPDTKDWTGTTSEASPKQSSILTPLSIAQKPDTKDTIGTTKEVSPEDSKIQTPLSIAQKTETKDSAVPHAPRGSTTFFPKNNLWDMFINRCMIKTDVTFSDLPVKEFAVKHDTMDPNVKIDAIKDMQSKAKDDQNVKIKLSTEKNKKHIGIPAKDRKEEPKPNRKSTTHSRSRLNKNESITHPVKHTTKTKTAESKIYSKTSAEKISVPEKPSKKSPQKNQPSRPLDNEQLKALPIPEETPTDQDITSEECSMNMESVFQCKDLRKDRELPVDVAVTDSVANTGDRPIVFPTVDAVVTGLSEDTGEHPKELLTVEAVVTGLSEDTGEHPKDLLTVEAVVTDSSEDTGEHPKELLTIDAVVTGLSEDTGEHPKELLTVEAVVTDSSEDTCEHPKELLTVEAVVTGLSEDTGEHPKELLTVDAVVTGLSEDTGEHPKELHYDPVDSDEDDSFSELMIDLEHHDSKSDSNEEENLLIDPEDGKLHPCVTPTVQEPNSDDNTELMVDLEQDESKSDANEEEKLLIETEGSQLHPSVTLMEVQEPNEELNKTTSHAISPSKPKDDVAQKETSRVGTDQRLLIDIITSEEQIETTEELPQALAASEEKISPENVTREKIHNQNTEKAEISRHKLEKIDISSNQQEVEETAIGKLDKKVIGSSKQEKKKIYNNKFEEVIDKNVGDEKGIHNDELEEGNYNNNSKNVLQERDVYDVIGGEIIKNDQKKGEIVDYDSLERGVCNVEGGEIINYQHNGEILESDLEDGEIEDEDDEIDTSASVEQDEGKTVLSGEMVFDNIFVACSPVSSFEPQTDEELLDIFDCNETNDGAARKQTTFPTPCQVGSRTGSVTMLSPTEEIETPLSINSVQTEDVDESSRASTPLLDEINELDVPEVPGLRTVILPKSVKQCPQVKSQVSIPEKKKRRNKTNKSKNQTSEPDLLDIFQGEKLSRRRRKRLRRQLRKQLSELPDSPHEDMKGKIKKEEKRTRKANQVADLWTEPRARGTQEHPTHKKQHVTDWDKLLQKHIHEMKRPKSIDAKTTDLNKKIDSFLIEIDLKNNKNCTSSFLPSNQTYIERTNVLQRPGKVPKQVNFGNLIDVQSYTSARGETSFGEREQFDHDSLMDSIIISSTYQEENQGKGSKKRRRHTADSDSESEDEDSDPRKFQRTSSRSLPRMNRDIAIQQRNNPDTGLHQYLFLYEDSRPCTWIDSDEIKENNPHFYNSLKKCFVPKEDSQEQSEMQQKLYNLVGFPS